MLRVPRHSRPGWPHRAGPHHHAPAIPAHARADAAAPDTVGRVHPRPLQASSDRLAPGGPTPRATSRAVDGDPRVL